jgi:hypothetical protein
MQGPARPRPPTSSPSPATSRWRGSLGDSTPWMGARRLAAARCLCALSATPLAVAQEAEDPFAEGGALEDRDSGDSALAETGWGILVFLIMVFPVVAFGYHAYQQNQMARSLNNNASLMTQ